MTHPGPPLLEFSSLSVLHSTLSVGFPSLTVTQCCPQDLTQAAAEVASEQRSAKQGDLQLSLLLLRNVVVGSRAVHINIILRQNAYLHQKRGLCLVADHSVARRFSGE